MIKKTLIFISLFLVITAAILSVAQPPQEIQKKKIEVKKEKLDKKPQTKPTVLKILAIAEKKSSVAKNKKKNPSKNKLPKSGNKPKEKVSVKRQTFAKHKPQKKSNQLHSASYKINREIIHDGKQLIEDNKSIPIIQASYGRIGFDNYLSRIKNLGGRLFVGDTTQQRIVAEAIISDGGNHFQFVKLNKNLKGFGAISLFRPREISGEILVDQILSSAKKSFKDGDLRCVVLLPLDKEAAMLGAMENYLKKSNYQISQFDLAWGEYTRSVSSFGLRLNKARIRETGKIVNMDMTLIM